MEKPIGTILDPLFKNQWNLRQLRVPEAWAYTQGEGAVIGIIDSGCDGSHKDLGWDEHIEITANDNLAQKRAKYQPVLDAIKAGAHPKLLPGWNFVDSSTNTWDWHRHGTYMAGTMSAESDGFGMVGVAPMAKIRPYVVLDSKGWGTQETVAKAVLDAAEDGCDVISMSLGWTYPLDVLRNAILTVLGRYKCIVVAAAGNLNKPMIKFPAAYAGMIAVGGCIPTGERWAHSSTKGSCYGVGLTCVGPAAPQVTTQRMRSRFTKNVDATSMACANIAGVAALAKSMDKQLGQKRFKLLLEKYGSNDIWDAETGWGVPNALGIVKDLSTDMPNLKELQAKLYDLSYEIYNIGEKLGQMQEGE